MTQVVVSGARGRLGAQIVRHIEKASDLRLVAGLVRSLPDESNRFPWSTEPRECIRAGTVLIEAALVPAALQHVEVAAQVGAPVCIATTGFDAPQRHRLEAASNTIPVLLAPNLSMGVTLLLELVKTAARALPGYHLEVLEMHHARKRDAPSGTAWALAEAADAARGRSIEKDAILARAGETGARGQHEVGMQTLRGGSVIGEHTVFLVGDTERIELSHRAQSREAFAVGAVSAARFLAQPGLQAGLYSMADVLGLATPR